MEKTKKKIIIYNFEVPYLLNDIDYPVGGAAVDCANWLWGFNEAEYDISLMTWKGSVNYISKPSFNIIETYNLDTGIRKMRFLFYRIPVLFMVIRKNKPDYLIQKCAGVNTGILSIICRILGVNFVYRVASDIDVDERIKETLKLYEYVLYKIGLYYTRIISCQNSYQLQKFKHKYPHKKVFQIYNSIKITNAEIVKSKDQRSYFAWIGNLSYVKNMGALVNIADANPDLHFKIAGMETSKTNNDTRAAISKLRKLSNIEFVGYVKRSEITTFFSEAIALINTSWFEGFSNTFLEAWSVGTPVITTINANPSNIIEEYKIGFVASKYEKLSEYVRYIDKMTNHDYNILAQNCQKYVINNHDPVKLSKIFYNNIIS